MFRRPTLQTACMAVLRVALVLTLGGCGHPVQRQLEGRWHGDSVELFADASIAPATAWVRGTSFEFAANELTVMIPPEEVRSGTYEVSSVNGRDVQLLVRGGDGKGDPMRLKLDSEHSMRWMLEDGRAIVLKREL